MSGRSESRSPRWYGVLFRAAAMTFLGTLLTFTVTLFLAIIGTFVAGKIRGQHPDMTFAYRHVAAPVAIVAGCVLLVGSLIFEIRHYRQLRALSTMARIS